MAIINNTRRLKTKKYDDTDWMSRDTWKISEVLIGTCIGLYIIYIEMISSVMVILVRHWYWHTSKRALDGESIQMFLRRIIIHLKQKIRHQNSVGR